jgi:hypothetical protein
MKTVRIREYLSGGDRRSIGRADELVRLLQHQPDLLPELIQQIWSEDPLVAMRAADAVEKLTRTQAHGLQSFKKELLGLAAETSQPELRWHLAAMLPRLHLSPAERQRAFRVLTEYLQDKSSIVKTFAIQGLFDLSVGDPGLRPQVEEVLRVSLRDGTAAMRARSRKLIKLMEKARR